MKLSPNLKHLDKTKIYVVGVSFGPDSMALLHMLFNAGYGLHVVHVNYRLRATSDLEQSQLEQYCLQHDLPMHALVVETMPKGNIQGEARTIRYDFFKKILNEVGAEAILTAHHWDDDLETAFMQDQRAKMHPYYGIPIVGEWQGTKVIRPLIDIKKTEILKYCQEQLLPFAIDASNETPKYLRNRIRKTLQSMPEQQQTKLHLQYQAKNHQLQKLQSELNSWMGHHAVPINTYVSWEHPKQFLYWVMLQRHHCIQKPITEGYLLKIKQMVASKKPNITMKLNEAWIIEKAYDKLWLIDQTQLKPYAYIKPSGVIKMPYLAINMDALPKDKQVYKLRSCLPTDKVIIRGYETTFRRLAIDWKMPRFLRKIWPVFLNQKREIVWLPRYQTNVKRQANNWLEILE
jgi:bifunctional protein TilS/HprT